jgi:hypothetical protein
VFRTRLRTEAPAFFALLTLFSAPACNGSPAPSGGDPEGDAAIGDDAGGSPIPGQGDPKTLVGTFHVKVVPPTAQAAGSTSVVGKVYDGPTPSTLVWENPQVDGSCTLTTPRVPYCTTPCGGSSACVEDDTCQSYPTAHDVGKVAVTGLKLASGDSSFTMTAIASAYQPPAGVALVYPPFGEGDAVNFVASGGYFDGFTLASQGIAPLALLTKSVTLKSGEPLELTWTPGAAGQATVHVKLDISHHGGSKGQILCDTDDGGSLTVSAALVKRLIDLGVAGYPSVIVTRHAVGSAVIAPGRVDLDIESVVEEQIGVEGLKSCTGDSDCSSGQHCQSDLTCK